MKKLFSIMATVTVFFIFVSSGAVRAESKNVNKINDSIEVFTDIMKIPEKEIPPVLFRNASGIAIIPGVIKAGFIIGGRYGSGILIVRDKLGRWSNPSFITLTGGSLGWQLGVESIDIVLVFKSSRSIDGIVKGKFTLGVDASIAAGPVGRGVEAATDVELRSEIYSYSRSRGLFAGLAFSGAALQIDDVANDDFYSKGGISVREIFSNNELTRSPVVERLKKILSEYSYDKTKN